MLTSTEHTEYVFDGYTAPPPNEHEGYISDLKFGKKDYEKERDEWYKRNNREYKLSKKEKRKPRKFPSWRTELTPSDPWALLPIWCDPDESLKSGSYKKIQLGLWCPRLMEELIKTHPGVLNALLKSSQNEFSYPSVINLSEQVDKFFCTMYKEGLFDKNKAYRTTWDKARKIFLETGSIIVARWCCEQFCESEEESLDWIVGLAKYANLPAFSDQRLAVSSCGEEDDFILDLDYEKGKEKDNSGQKDERQKDEINIGDLEFDEEW